VRPVAVVGDDAGDFLLGGRHGTLQSSLTTEAQRTQRNSQNESRVKAEK
jgi:hypothetical protein